jgi:hypothetical protein
MPAASTTFVPSSGGEMTVIQNLSNSSITPGGDIGLIIPTYQVVLTSTTSFYLVSYADHNDNWLMYGWLEGTRIK